MAYPVNTSIELRAVLRALRQSRNLTQAQLGELLGVNQKRVARIETAPGVTSFDQIARVVNALGGRLQIEAGDDKPDTPTTRRRRKSTTPGTW